MWQSKEGVTLARAKPDRKTKAKSLRRGFPRYGWLLVTLAMAAIIVLARSHLHTRPAWSNNGTKPKAAIVDQLYALQPNESFVIQVTRELEEYGFEVDLHRGDEITVDFYRQLPSYGYKLIVFRAHSGLLETEGELIEKTLLFTNEPYSRTRHIPEQLSDQVTMAKITARHPYVFAIGPEFVTRSMEGQFDNTIIIVMGCSCLYIPDLAEAFVEKGASVYLAWNASVDLDYVDRATLYLIEQLCSGKVTIAEAVSNTMNVVGPDPEYNAVLKYFPASSGVKTLKELIPPP